MRVCVDVGGTFTDCLVLDDRGTLHEFKSSTTPADPVGGFLAALEKAARHWEMALGDFLGQVDLLVHGTTLATNSLVTGRGARMGMVTTEGFRDVIEIRRGIRKPTVSMYDPFVAPYEPLVPRDRRLGVAERVRNTGHVEQALDEGAVRGAARTLGAAGVESVAVCFLHSYANAEHERRAAEICKEELGPGVHVVASHDILPVWREFERFSTTVVSAYLGPTVDRFLVQLDEGLARAGFGGTLMLVLSSGLVQPLGQTLGRAAYLLSSGPAAAPSGALRLSGGFCRGNVLSADMGGTSFDVCLLRDGAIPATTEAWVGDHRVALKMVDVTSIGAGGGSIAWVDALGLLRVGPDSAGADPGPACYRRGNTRPTVTDANLVLGYLPNDNPLGDEIALDVESSRSALQGVGDQLNLGVLETAQAIHDTVNAQMADQITEVCTRRGFDVREFQLTVGGGAGPLHAAAIATRLGLESVFVPRLAGLLSAFGMFAMDLGRDFARSYVARADACDPDAVSALLADMEREARKALEGVDADPGAIVLERTAEMRYAGQFHEVEVPVSEGPVNAESLKAAVEHFHRLHERLFTFATPWLGVEFLTFRLKAYLPARAFHMTEVPSGSGDASGAMRARRRCIWGGEDRETAVYAADRLRAGDRIPGPAVVEEHTTTVAVPPGFSCDVDAFRNYFLHRNERGENGRWEG